jgi:probable biosynthetic protein (TIGR04098 family)
MSKFWSFLSRQQTSSLAQPGTALPDGARTRQEGSLDEQVVALIRREYPAFSAADMQKPFDDLGIDSVGMLMLHTAVEEATNNAFDRHQWDEIVTPADLVNALRAATGEKSPHARETTAERRSYMLNMPQMALGGLSEHWLFKELGDMHWGTLTRAFACPSHLLRDDAGERIYATFTRIRLEATCPIADFEENEPVGLDISVSRHGAGMFFGDAVLKGRSGSIDAKLMSSFSKFGQGASNMSLLKGLPGIPPDFPIPAVPEFPEFGQDYRARRSLALPAAIFECEYEIIPAYDINGVGLLYFAAYPIINDICAARHAGRSLMVDFSTVRRDVFYFANSDPHETLLYRLHEWRAEEGSIDMAASICRKSDGNVMAHVLTRKVRPQRAARAR